MTGTDLNEKYHGSILIIADEEEVLLQKSYGFSAHDNMPNETNSRHGIASLGKMPTAVAVMQLVESRQIALG